MALQSNIPRLFFVVFFAFILLYVAPAVEGADNPVAALLDKISLEVEPSLSYRLEYEDNIDYDTSDKQSDFSNHYKPGITVRSIGKQYLLHATATLNVAEYTSEKDYNFVNQDYSLGLAYRVNDRLDYTLDGAYRITNNINRDWETGDGDAPVGEYYERYKNKTKTFSGGVNYALSERSRLGLFGSFVQFDTLTADSSDFYMARADYSYTLAARTKLELTANYFYYDFTYSRNFDITGDGLSELFSYGYTLSNYTIMGGFTHTFLNNAKLVMHAGYRYTTADTSQSGFDEGGAPFKESDSGNGDGWVARVELEKRFNDFEFLFQGNRDLSVDSQGNTSESTRLSLSTTYDITRRFAAQVKLRMQRSYVDPEDDSFGYTGGRDTYTYYVSSGLTYKLYRWLDTSLGYSYRYSDYKKSGSTVHANVVYINLEFIPLRSLVIR